MGSLIPSPFSRLASAAVSGLVGTSAQTFAGDKTFNGKVISGLTGAAGVSVPTDGYLSFSGDRIDRDVIFGNSTALNIHAPWSNRVYLRASLVEPWTTNAQSLGSSGQRWSNVQSVLGNFSGLISAANAGVSFGDGNANINKDVTLTGINLASYGHYLNLDGQSTGLLRTNAYGLLSNYASPFVFSSAMADGAGAVALAVDTSSAWVNAGAKLVSVRNGGAERTYLSANNGQVVSGLAGGGVYFGAFVSDLHSATGSFSHHAASATLGMRNANGAVFMGINLGTGAASASGLFTAPGLVASTGATGVSIGGQAITHNGTLFNFPTRATTGEYWQSSAAGCAFYCANAAGAFQATASVNLLSEIANGASAVGVKSNTFNAFSTEGSKIHSFQTNSVEKAYVTFDGRFGIGQVASASLPAAAAGNKGQIVYDATTNKLRFSTGSAWETVTSA